MKKNLDNSQTIQIANGAKIRRYTVRKDALERKPRVQLDNLRLVPQKNEKIRVSIHQENF